jgi:hypothetical protein
VSDAYVELLDVAVALAALVEVWETEGVLNPARARPSLLQLAARVDPLIAAFEQALTSDPRLREQIDPILLRARMLARRMRATPTVAAAPLDAARVLAIARATLAGRSGAHVAPDIAEHKRAGAAKRYLRDLGPDEQLIALLDLTVFGGATDGVAFLDRRLIHRLGSDPVSIPYDAVRDLFVDRRHVTVGETRLDLLTPSLAETFADFLRAIAEVRQ